MEPTSNNSQVSERNGSKPLLITAAIVIPVAIAGYLLFGRSNEATAPTNPDTTNGNTTPTGTDTLPVTEAPQTKYKDGTYSVTGSYVSPGGPETIPVTITLKDDVITAATMTVNASNPNTTNFQTQFHDNFKQFVVGKNIDEVKLVKVSGSSLTPKGFNDALTKVKVAAEV